MSERKVLSKYYPPDFDPRQLQRRATKGAGPQVQTVRLMSPFSMRCTSCDEYIGKGRKFNVRKSTPDEKYLGIQIFRFFIRCTRCSSEITFRTDPQTSDYVCEAGAKRNTELWWSGDAVTETLDERLDRITVADALDEVRSRNARLEKLRREGLDPLVPSAEGRVTAEGEKDEEDARRAFALRSAADADPLDQGESPHTDVATDAMTRQKRPPKQTKLLPGLKRADAPSSRPPLVDYGSDTD
ncbi:mRNA splicing protein yju2 [Colletotrichum musicola]|uniref:Splicing factor YJU2 n=1 Tax=Colletotrichum musicola TaxID=2175873 RepID=A0A8H6N8R3_9PEZI|nr:mRNA splicing protein yju2 [Colletotrichum musicola]